MNWDALAWMVQFEWLFFELALLAFLSWELYSVRRSIRRDREAAAKARQDAAEAAPTGPVEG